MSSGENNIGFTKEMIHRHLIDEDIGRHRRGLKVS